MTKDYFKYYNSKTLPIVIAAILFLLWIAKDNWALSISIFATLTTLLLLISTYLWNWRPFSYLFWIDDFSGRYEGILTSQYEDPVTRVQSAPLKHVKVVNQNGHSITIHSFTIKIDGTKSTMSVNKGMHIEKTGDGKHYRLIYNYLNEGSTDQVFPPHYGTDEVKFIKSDQVKRLVGNYYTNRTPQTKGEFELNWVSDDTNHVF